MPAAACRGGDLADAAHRGHRARRPHADGRCRIERTDNTVIDCGTVPLPDGATLVTFHDVTDSVNVERVLTERNEALEAADAIKIDFVQHVSYELRSPLTNIIGFTHFLDDPRTGPLTDKQREYLGYITASSNALLAIINNILDLASIGAGAMQLELEPVDIRATMHAAAEGVQDRLVKNNIALDIKAPRRHRQLRRRRAAHPAGPVQSARQCGRLLAARRDRGADRAARRRRGHLRGQRPRARHFQRDARIRYSTGSRSETQGTRHRGAGLGLSIVRSFVELHGGKVSIEFVLGRGHDRGMQFPFRLAARSGVADQRRFANQA